MKSALALAATTMLAVSTLSACGDSATTGQDGERTIAAAFYPLAWVAEQVAGEDWTVENLTSPGGEPHDLELSINQTLLVSEAALVVHEHGFQPAVDAAVAENATGEVLDATDVVDLEPVAGHETGSDTEDEHGDEEADEDGHDHGDLDPHFWQDPTRMADLADAVAERLATLDPDGASTYEQNAAGLRGELEDLDQEYADGLAGCRRTAVVVSHDAFGYLDRYGLELHPILGLSPEAEPSAATLRELRELIESDGITTVFTETLASPKAAEALAREAGVDTEVLDPIEGLGADTADEDYLSLMRSNLAALQEANGC